MNEVEIADYRKTRLLAAIEHVSDGDKTAFGRRLGYKDGAFIRQMISGRRNVSEHTVNKIEALPGMAAWFSKDLPEGKKTKVVASLGDRLNSDLVSRYSMASAAARAVVDVVLRREGEQLPIWASRPLLSAVETALAIAESVRAPAEPRKRVRR